ncbi:hypothetical protein DES52_11877 [Deinococcus yavapaiensis KR-236]|uniref:Uncharacterized protein n=1 Tax=Deinococcus yavapaiensis KR-236 TaxID=694435 RepID=A0A318S6K1_9DEIO|nr:hypothetical protein DES52_11877 [Deinococcus yavapaiensis KR-236]
MIFLVLMPHDLPPWQTVYHDHRIWRLSDVWEQPHTKLRELLRMRLRRKSTPSAAIADSQTARTSEAGGSRGYSPSMPGSRIFSIQPAPPFPHANVTMQSPPSRRGKKRCSERAERQLARLPISLRVLKVNNLTQSVQVDAVMGGPCLEDVGEQGFEVLVQPRS